MGDHAAAESRSTPRWVALAWSVITAATALMAAPHAMLGIILDIAHTVILLGPAVLFGAAIVPRLGLGRMPRRWHWLLAVALGIGGFSLLILAMGLVGLLSRAALTFILIAMSAIGLWSHGRWPTYVATDDEPPSDDPAVAASRGKALSPARSYAPWSVLLLLTAPFAGLAVVAASNTPGILWSEEGFGYDVLEYHLQLPREYRAEGRISYRAHNVYANFPANVEMLYLAAMVLVDADVEAGTTANHIHLALGALAVYAAWVVARGSGRRAGIVAATAVGTCGWLPYLSGMAYVEHGVLFFGIVALGVVLRATTHCGENDRPCGRWFVVGGVIAGLAFGCKYTAGPMVVLPIAVSILAAPVPAFRGRLRGAVGFCIGAAVSFAPWAIKNVVATGNPLFPLAQSVFDAMPEGWDAESQARWDQGHAPPSMSFASLASHVWNMIIYDRHHRFGPALFVLAGMAQVTSLLAAQFPARLRAMSIVAAVQLAVWGALTHQYARFASVLLIPLPLMAGASLVQPTLVRRRVVGVILCLGAMWNLAATWRLHRSESPGGVPSEVFVDGLLPGFEYLTFLNDETPADARMLLVGEARPFYIDRELAYCVVFNRNPLVARVREHGADELAQWLQAQGFDYVLINWAEIDRLSSTYGFAPEISPHLFDQLQSRGLVLERAFPAPRTGRRYIEIYRVPTPGA